MVIVQSSKITVGFEPRQKFKISHADAVETAQIESIKAVGQFSGSFHAQTPPSTPVPPPPPPWTGSWRRFARISTFKILKSIHPSSAPSLATYLVSMSLFASCVPTAVPCCDSASHLSLASPTAAAVSAASALLSMTQDERIVMDG